MLDQTSMTDRPFAPPLLRRVVIELAGEPKGKGRPRFSRKGGFAYTPQPTRNYEAALRYAGQIKMADAAPIEGALKVEVLAAFPVPQSWSKIKQARAYAGTLRPTGRPDLDNVLKMLDGLNGVVWRDDAQIVDARIVKRYSDRPRLRIEVEQIFTGAA
jgi:Holliday junction resolvase RusA-like endonuclease